VEAAARLREAAALRELGEAPRALAAAKDAREKMLALGMKSDANHALRRIATILYDMGETQKARELFEQQLAEARATGFRVSLKAGLIDYAMLLIRIDDRLAIPYHKEALEMAIEDGDEPGQQAALGNLSLSLMNIGEIEDARVKLEKATEMARRLGRKLDYPIRLGNLTELHIELGRLPEAQKYAEEASEKYQEIQHEDGIANIRQLQGTILRELGDPAGARGRYEECVRIAEKLAIKGRLAHCRRELAWLAAGRGELDEAERLAKLARAQGEAEKRPPMVAGADNVLARVAARRGKGDEARKLLAAVDALAKGPVRVYTLWREATEAAITRAMIGEKKDAAAQLRAIAEAAAKKAFKQRASDARKALAALP
jgi:tetratricopeptide (TPR) repeat protein